MAMIVRRVCPVFINGAPSQNSMRGIALYAPEAFSRIMAIEIHAHQSAVYYNRFWQQPQMISITKLKMREPPPSRPQEPVKSVQKRSSPAQGISRSCFCSARQSPRDNKDNDGLNHLIVRNVRSGFIPTPLHLLVDASSTTQGGNTSGKETHGNNLKGCAANNAGESRLKSSLSRNGPA